MPEFAVWAPGHSGVEVDVDGVRHPLTASDGGWWRAVVADAGPGSRYGFSVDGGPLRPDPRSASQPDGIDGLSELVDQEAFAWSDGAWTLGALADAVLYELHIGTFTPEGTFAAAIDRLDYLVELGVTAIEIMPVAEYSGDHGWGYDGVDLFAPHHAYGGPQGLKTLVDAAHVRGLAVVLDVVYNHLGPAGNYLAEFGPYFTDRYRTPWGTAVNYDGAGSDEVRRLVIDNALMWLGDYHVDGLRLDAVHAIIDQSALYLLEELVDSVEVLSEETGHHHWLIAESDRNDPRLVAAQDRGGFGLGAVWSDDFHHAIHALLTGERDGYYADFGSVANLAKALTKMYVYGRDFSPYRDRMHGRPVGDLPACRFVIGNQNHDQVGNRATGNRLAELVSVGYLKIAAALTLTNPAVPMLFQGEEWGASTPFLYFTDHPDPALGKAVSEGRTHEWVDFGWDPSDIPDPQDPATWRRSVLDWDELTAPPHDELLAWYRSLIALRRELPALRDARLSEVFVRFSEAERWLRLDRGSVSVVVNLAEDPQGVPVPSGSGVVLASAPVETLAPDRLRLAGESVAVVAS